jgi:sugar phosphate isomerase/epimerase
MPKHDNQLAISTVWASAQAEEAASLLDSLAESGLNRLELEYRLTPGLIEGIKKELRPRELSVVSMHNYCPVPADIPREQASGDLFNLADLDKEMRLTASRYTTRTMELAADLEAPAVVLHLGFVEGIGDRQTTREAAQAGQVTPALSELLEQRKASAANHLDAVSFSLERLIERALDLGVELGLENRFHAHQIPNFDEVGFLLERFKGAPIGYWHDTGHAWVGGLAGLTPQKDWLTAYGQSLLGCHLHDAVDDQDHLPPGTGDMDWEDLCPLLQPARFKVLEVAPGPEAKPLAQAAEMLAHRFAQAEAQSEKEAQLEGGLT